MTASRNGTGLVVHRTSRASWFLAFDDSFKLFYQCGVSLARLERRNMQPAVDTAERDRTLIFVRVVDHSEITRASFVGDVHCNAFKLFRPIGFRHRFALQVGAKDTRPKSTARSRSRIAPRSKSRNHPSADSTTLQRLILSVIDSPRCFALRARTCRRAAQSSWRLITAPLRRLRRE